ncbi:hypothetical protein GCM10018966_045430 [Streptomyces yanii]
MGGRDEGADGIVHLGHYADDGEQALAVCQTQYEARALVLHTLLGPLASAALQSQTLDRPQLPLPVPLHGFRGGAVKESVGRRGELTRGCVLVKGNEIGRPVGPGDQRVRVEQYDADPVQSA